MSLSPAGIHNRDNELKLDPGVPARRNHSLGCKSIFIIILVTIGSIATLFIGQIIVSIFHGVREPHAALLYKPKSTLDLGDPATVVRPLIAEKQTFDIVATVWLRTNGSSFGSDNMDQKLDDANDGIVAALPTERAIFTGTVFRELKLKDQEIRTTVKYKVPTEIFKNRDLNHYDLRASFVLIPTSPSLLDNLTNYSSWRNQKILFPPFRSWPDIGPAPTLQDKAIDSFGVSIGLVKFLGIQSRCGLNTSNAANTSEHTFSEDAASDEDLDDEIDDDTPEEKYRQPSKAGHSQLLRNQSSKGKPVLESHPYIISRSVILAVDRMKLYDRKAYNQAHKQLKTNACGLASSPPNYDWKLCNRRFRNHGNMDTRLQLKMAENENKTRTHWAYAPYLTLAGSVWTPKDLVPVPVNREDCTKGGRFNNSEPLSPDEEFVDITWEIVYSGRTPAKITLFELFQVASNYNMTDTEANRQAAQWDSETCHRVIIQIVTTLLNIHYWYTRSSTVGISKFAITLIAVITLGKYLLAPFFPENGFFITLVTMIAVLPFQTSFLMLKVVWRIEFGWGPNKGKENWMEKEKKRGRGRMCLPSLNFVKATHRERASDRLDRSISWTVKLSLFILCCFTYFLLSPITPFLIPPLGLPTSQADEFWLRDTLLHSLTLPGFILGSGFQLWFNHRSHTFAGEYKLAAMLKGVQIALDMLKFSTRVLGTRDVREGFSVHNLVDSIIVAVWCWQAVMLPNVSQGEIDDEAE